jgi:hypothetical protein
MGKLTIEQAKKFMEAVNNADTNPVENKFYPKNKITTADKIDTGEKRFLPDKKTKKMPGKNVGKVKTLLLKPFDPNRETKLETPLLRPTKDRKTGLQYATGVNKYSKGSKKKMPKARDMAMGNKNIVYLGDPYMVDGKMFDPVKAHPEDYLRPKGAKTYSEGGEINVGKGGDYIKDLID